MKTLNAMMTAACLLVGCGGAVQTRPEDMQALLGGEETTAQIASGLDVALRPALAGEYVALDPAEASHYRFAALSLQSSGRFTAELGQCFGRGPARCDPTLPTVRVEGTFAATRRTLLFEADDGETWVFRYHLLQTSEGQLHLLLREHGTRQVAVYLAAGAGEPCGDNVCGAGTYCCNASCGICAPPNVACITLLCAPADGGGSLDGGMSPDGGASMDGGYSLDGGFASDGGAPYAADAGP